LVLSVKALLWPYSAGHLLSGDSSDVLQGFPTLTPWKKLGGAQQLYIQTVVCCIV